jgi:hypothetical protein
MGSVVSYPSDLIGCYDGLTYQYSITITSNTNPPAVEIEILINGSAFQTLYLSAYSDLTIAGSSYIYTFTLDIAQIVQSFFDNNALFHNFENQGTFTYYSSADFMANVVLDFYDYTPDSNGVLTRASTAVRSSARKFFNSLLQDMDDYTAAIGRLFLTTRTDYRLSDQVTNLISIYGDAAVNNVRIDKDGTIYDIPLASGQITLIRLNAYFDANTTSLRLYAGLLEGVDFTANSETIIYSILPDECDLIGLHFLNHLGTPEVFTFRTYEYEINRDRESELYVSSDNKVRAYNGQIEKNINIERNGFFTEEWTFFSDVVTSPVYYIEEVYRLEIYEVFATFNNTPYRTISGLIDIRLSFTYSDKQKVFIN